MPVADTTPHGFDVLNLHTHGMHVSPKGHSDNVLLNLFPSDSPKHTVHHCKQQIAPDPITKADCAQGQWPMLVNLPNQHPSGTYWYHTHKHGAVALHLASGLSGALIVQDYQNGLESLPQVASLVGTANEKVMLLQQIAFGPSSPAPAPTPAPSCPAATPTPPPPPPPTPPTGTQYVNCWGVYNHPISCKYDSQFVASSSANAQFSVNGQFNPVITMQQGQPQLWRMVNTTPAQVMPVCLVPLTGTSTTPPALYVLAADGTPVHHKKAPSGSLAFQLQTPVSNVVENPLGLANNEFQFLAPGQRLDLLVQPSNQGQFVLWSAQSVTQLGQLCPTSLSPSQLGALQSNVVAFVNVTANSGTPPANPIPSQAQLNQLYNPTSVHGHQHTPTAPTQGVVFGFTNASYTPTDKNCPINSKIGGASVVNGRPFYEGRIQRRLQLNQADMWGVQSAVDTHMFHIHTNPFQMVTRGNVKYPFPIWRDTALINCSPVASGGSNCAFLAGLTSQFVDSNGNPTTAYGEVVQFVSRAVDFTGPIVMHCHNTEHEDNGMMELVEITDAKGDSSTAKPGEKHKH
jgi:FtsP/CotA-like multicopper oxidase with cupredoxin domain